jgi:hypothetical protein
MAASMGWLHTFTFMPNVKGFEEIGKIKEYDKASL